MFWLIFLCSHGAAVLCIIGYPAPCVCIKKGCSMKYAESILVVPRVALAAAQLLSEKPGVLSTTPLLAQSVQQVIADYRQFLPRGEMERNPEYKQIIPYMVFIHDRRLFVMQRSAAAGEQRLAGAYTIGIGGHVRESDYLHNEGDLAEWGRREFAEEIAYDGGFSAITLVGLVNDDTNEVGRVHLGVAFVLHADSNAITVRSELQSGVLMDRDQCAAVYDQMETWSKMVFDAIKPLLSK